MKTFERVCIERVYIEDEYEIVRGKQYITSDVDERGTVAVFTSKWIFNVPVEVFAGERVFTK